MADKIARCAIYDKRPEVCRKYPTIHHYMPPECTYNFIGSERRGDCSCEAGVCCSIPRENGESGGAPIPAEAGGEPCKHLVWEPVMEKKASDENIASESEIRDTVKKEMGWG